MSIVSLFGALSVATAQPPATHAAPRADPPPYSLPWQLRPLMAADVVRTDSTLALYEAGGEPSATFATTLLASWAVTPSLAPLVRLAAVHDSAGADPSGTALVNPLVGALYATRADEVRLTGFGAFTVPVGTGGGLDPDPADAAAPARGIAARSGLDNALFAVDYFTLVAGAGAGWVEDGVTVQIEATVLQLLHVRGPTSEDPRKTNLTAGVHAGYALRPWLTVGGELRHQRWVSTPAAVAADPTLRDTTTIAAGPRLHLRVGDLHLRPGISGALPLDAPLAPARYRMVQLDVPIVF